MESKQFYEKTLYTKHENLQGKFIATTMIQLTPTCLVTANGDEGDNDPSIRLWKLGNNFIQKDRFLNKHSQAVVTLLKLTETSFLSGSRDNSILIWNLHEGKTKEDKAKELGKHDQAVLTLIRLNDGRVASGSQDSTIKIWSLDDHSSRMLKKEHLGSVHSLLQLKDNRLLSGSGDFTIRIWKPTVDGGFDPVAILFGHVKAITSLCQLTDEKIISISSDRTIRIWKERDKQVPVSEKPQRNQMIMSSSFDEEQQKNLNDDVGGFICSQFVSGFQHGLISFIKLKKGRFAVTTEGNTTEILEPFTFSTNESISALALMELDDGKLATGSNREFAFYENQARVSCQCIIW